MMKQGMIILGYPGIGKSSIAGFDRYIDLDASNFRFFPEGPKISGWEKVYVQFAVDIARQGYTVLIGTHASSVRHFAMNKESYDDISIGIICPSAALRDAWIDRLRTRMLKTKLPKDQRAYDKACDSFDQDIWKLTHSGLPCVELCSMDCDLREPIKLLRGHISQ